MLAGARWRLGPLALIVAAGCAGSGFQYISNRSDHVFFKVPDDWAVYDETEVITAGVTELDAEIANALRDRTWLRGFDSGPEPNPEAVLDRAASHPRGYAEVRQLTFEERDGLSLAALRSWGFGFDPLQEARERPDGQVQLIHLEDVTTDDGGHGVRLIVLLDGDTGPSVVDQTVLLDVGTTRLYRFTIGCSVQCYRDNKDLITDIAESWTLKEVP
jgi:hypothetical protein